MKLPDQEKEYFERCASMNPPNITTETCPSAADVAVLSEGLRSYGIMEIGGIEPLQLACFLRHEGSIVGGGCGRVVGTRFLLDLLWVHKHWRNNGHGRELLRTIEEQASLQGCVSHHEATVAQGEQS